MVRPIEWTEERLHKLGKELLKCMKQDDVYHISSFFIESEVKQQNYYSLVEKYPLLAEYHKKAMDILAKKLMYYAMNKTPSHWLIKTYLPRYLNDRDQLEAENYRDELLKAKAKLEAIDNAVSNKGAISEYIDSQKAIRKILDE